MGPKQSTRSMHVFSGAELWSRSTVILQDDELSPKPYARSQRDRTRQGEGVTRRAAQEENMTFVLSTSAKLPFGFEPRVSFNYSKRDLPCHSFTGRARSLYRLVPIACSIKASTGKHIEYLTKFSSYLHNLAGQILDASPQPIKEFPWEKAKLMVEERLLVVGKNALTVSLIALLIFSLVYDALMAVFAGRELVVPLGLFLGVLLADLLNDFCQELFQSKAKGGNNMQQLWGIGLVFATLRFIYLRFRMPGWVLFCHIGNGGLMQILWLAKEMKQAKSIQNKEEMDALQATRN